MSPASIAFGLAAGALSVLSPCVLPLLPLVLGQAVAASRFGAVALAAGLVASFVAVGLFIAAIGFAIGLDEVVFRDASAVLLGLMGAALLSGGLQRRFAAASGPVANAGNRVLARFAFDSLPGQFGLGLLLGMLWSPCVGPTLGAASAVAAQGRDLGAAAAVMAAFGLGAAAPLLLVATLSREALTRWRGRMLRAGGAGKALLGSASLAVAALVLSGLDLRLEAAIVAASPDWLIDLTTRF